MGLFVLSETSAGYALLKSKDKKLLKQDDLAKQVSSAESVCNLYVCTSATLRGSLRSLLEATITEKRCVC